MKKIIMILILLFFVTACATATPREINDRAAMKNSGQGMDSERPLNFIFGAAKVIFGGAAALTGNPLELINVFTGSLDVAGSVQSTASSTEGAVL